MTRALRISRAACATGTTRAVLAAAAVLALAAVTPSAHVSGTSGDSTALIAGKAAR